MNSINAALPGHNYDFEHHQSPDQRGIDVAFIYDSNVVTPGLVLFPVIVSKNDPHKSIPLLRSQDFELIDSMYPDSLRDFYIRYLDCSFVQKHFSW